jgi:ketosteroid isomerase-like protein
MAHPNEDLARNAYDEFIKGGIGTVIELFDDGFVWHIGGRNRFSRDWRGKYGVSDFFRQLLDLTMGTFELEVREVMAADEHVAVLVHERARRDGKLHDIDTVHIWRVRNRWWERGSKEGSLLEFWRYPADTYADDAFFA